MVNEYDVVYWKTAELMELCKKTIDRIDAGLVGVAGPFWVMSILSRKAISFTPKFGRNRFDVLLGNGKKVEIKSSNLKVSDFRYYAWSAQYKPGELKYDFLFCVALPETLKLEPSTYIFTKTQIERMPPASKVTRIRFWGTQHKQILYLPDENWWTWEEQMGNLRKYSLENIKDLKSFLS